jgi:hypothetical protein
MLEDRLGDRLLAAWRSGRSSLRIPLPERKTARAS